MKAHGFGLLAVLVSAAATAGCGSSELGGSAGGGGSGGVAADAAGSGGAPALDAGGSGGATGSGGAAPTVDAAAETPADGAPDPNADFCKWNGTELCDGFESGAIDPGRWGMHVTAGSSVSVDGEQVHSGKYALHVKVVAGQTNTAQLTDAVTFPAKNNTFYTRAFIYFSPDLPADNRGGFHMAYLLATGNNDLGFVEAGLGSSGDKQYLGYSEYYGAGPNIHQHGPTFTEFGPGSPTRITPKKWLCLELMQGSQGNTTTRRIWVDGKELPEQVSNYSGRKPPTYELMSIGVLQYHPTPVLSDVWIDDVRIGSERIGCDLLSAP